MSLHSFKVLFVPGTAPSFDEGGAFLPLRLHPCAVGRAFSALCLASLAQTPSELRRGQSCEPPQQANHKNNCSQREAGGRNNQAAGDADSKSVEGGG
jgi:hypothetical protein